MAGGPTTIQTRPEGHSESPRSEGSSAPATPLRNRRAQLALLAGLTLAFTGGWVLRGADENRQVTRQELDLVRQVYESRDQYQIALERLVAFYTEISNEEGRQAAERELRDYHVTVKPPYSLELDLPAANLKPTENIPEANKSFQEGMYWLQKPAINDRGDNFKRAEIVFRRLLREHKTSNKIDEACYYLGEIYSSRYFNQPRRAVAFFERVFLYEPNTNLDARYRAALLYEKTLADRRRAIDLYQEVLKREVDTRQTREARRRLDDLLGVRR